MSTEYRPRIYWRYGHWKCALLGSEWPVGIGETQKEAFEDWENRWKRERNMK